MHVLLIFLDGIGLGEDAPDRNPFAVAQTPTLHALAGGARWLQSTPRTVSEQAIFLPTDPRLGVAGRPQSASGQATIMTGINVPQVIGEHYGPRPTQPIRDIVAAGNLYKTLTAAGLSTALLDAYPPDFFASVERGKRLLSSLQFAVHTAGVPIRTQADYFAGQAISPDFLGEGWREFLGFPDAPLYDEASAADLLVRLAQQHDFSMFSTWITDEIGHRGPFERGVEYLERFDRILAHMLRQWDLEHDLLLITSDHGNMEDLSIRQHTMNDIPTVAIGAGRERFAEAFTALTDITPAILRVLGVS
jgi:hypothetical protein